MRQLKTFIFITVIFIQFYCIISCNKVEKPIEITGKSDTYIDLGTTPPSAEKQAKHEIEGKNPFEWWYFDGHLDNGESFVATFYYPGYINEKPAVEISLYDKDWEKKEYLKKLSFKDMKSSQDDLDISCPAGYIRRVDKNTYDMGWNIDDCKADLKLTTLAPGWDPTLNNQDQEIESFWAIHQGKNFIEGTITKNGLTKKITGTGYADHNWGRFNKVKNTSMTGWVWGRIFTDKYTIVYMNTNYSDIKPLLSLYVAKNNSMIIGTASPVIKQWDFITHPVLKRHYPQQVSIDFAHEGKEVHIRLQNKALVEVSDLVDAWDVNFLIRWFIKTFIAQPTYFRIIANYNGTITENGKRCPVKGECLYEIMRCR